MPIIERLVLGVGSAIAVTVLPVHADQLEPEYVLFPRQEVTLHDVPVSTFQPSPPQLIGRIAGREAFMIDSPCESCEMGKAVTIDNNGYIWFLITREDKVIRLDPETFEMEAYVLPAGSGPYSMAIDRENVIWITAHGIEMLLEFDPTLRTITSHAPPSHGFMVHLAVDEQTSEVYFSQPGSNQVVRFDRTTGFTEFKIPTPNSGPARLVVDDKGDAWFPLLYANKLARLDPDTGQIDEWELPTPNGLPSFARIARDGSIWLSQPMADRIVRFDGAEFREYVVPTKQSIVSMQVEDENGDVWFTEGGWRGSAGGNKVGWLDPESATFEELEMPIPNSQPAGIAYAPDGTIWLQLSAQGKIVFLRKVPSQ